MTGIDHSNPCGEVDITVAFHIPDFGVAGLLGIDLCHHPDATGNRRVASAAHFCIQHGHFLMNSGPLKFSAHQMGDLYQSHPPGQPDSWMISKNLIKFTSFGKKRPAFVDGPLFSLVLRFDLAVVA